MRRHGVIETLLATVLEERKELVVAVIAGRP
jgi:hypothetical protein